MRSSKLFRNLVIFLTVISTTLGLLSQTVKAENASAYTYTISESGMWARTQDAYLTGSILFNDMGLNQPEDMYIKNGKIYIADTGNAQILVVDQNSNETQYIGKDILNTPTGIYVYDNGEILVADYGLSKVGLFSSTGELIRWYERPDSPIFGKNTNFNPKKVVSDDRGNIYIISEGSYDGVIQLSKEGEFIGYFGDNNTKLTVTEALQDLFFTDAQKAKLFNRIPQTFYNLAMDKKGMIYTVTQGGKSHAVKKHSVAGANMLNKNKKAIVYDEPTFVDISVANNGQIYAVTNSGLIYEYDTTGSVVFSFGGAAIANDKSGLFSVVSAIDVDENNYLYILDKERGIVQVFYPTSFAEMTHKAINLYDQGKYNESKIVWQEILKLSGNARIAHNGLGKAYFQEGNHEKALEHFEFAINVRDYSETFWEIRNNFLQSNGALIIIIITLIYAIYMLLKFLDKKYKILNPLRKFKQVILKPKIIRDIVLTKNMLKHPIDSMYYLRRGRHGSVAAATIIYFIAFIIFVANLLFSGFIFNIGDARSISYVFIVMQFFAPCSLAIVCNYLVSSINEGIGRLRDVYCLIAYSFSPYVIFMPFVILASYALTLNEAFIIHFSTIFIIVWCLVIFFIGLKEVHNYEIGDVIKNILLTVFLMCVTVIIGSIIYMLWDVLIEFVYSVVKELAYNVRR